MNFIKEKKFFLFGIFIIFVILFLDQITKHWAVNFIEEIIEKTNGVHTHVKKTSFFNIVLVHNTGISFGMFNNIYFMKYIIFFIILFITIFLIYLLWKSKNKIDIIAFSFIIAGAIGNIIDRINYGAVIDFLDFHIGNLHWPAFNVADSVICVGVFLYLLNDLFFKKNDISKSR